MGFRMCGDSHDDDDNNVIIKINGIVCESIESDGFGRFCF